MYWVDVLITPINGMDKKYKIKEGAMKTRILLDDAHTTITQTAGRITVKRHYIDVPDIVTYLANDVGDRLVADMRAADNSEDSVFGHYLSRHVKELYPTL
jgi:hypothetical protein